jgi:hypothetical protein
MFLALFNIFWILAAPNHWLGLFVLAAALCLLLRRARVASIFAFLAVVLPVLAGTSLRNGPLIRALENCYPHPYWPPHVGCMLVLGSGFADAVCASTALVRRLCMRSQQTIQRLASTCTTR